MPFLSPKRKISDAENKLRVLYCLNRLGMATQEQLWPFVAQLELMEYVPFCMFVDELLSDGAIAAGTHALAGCLYLTAAGRQQLELFEGRLVHADRERIEREAPEYAGRLSQRRQLRAAYDLSQDGVYRATGTVCEGDVPTLLVQARSQDGRMIERFVKRFAEVASQMLVQMYMLPLAQSDMPMPEVCSQEQALQMVQPGCPALCAYGGREHAAVVCTEEGPVQYTLMVLLPSAAMAWSWAQTAQESAAALAAGLTQLFAEAKL